MQDETGDAGGPPRVKLGSLWIGGELSWIEQLCIRSFLDHGHEVTLYTYQGVSNAPEGTILADAGAIFPATEFITHRATGSPAYHADAFRYRMIAATGLAWVDADMLCLQPWRAETDAPLFGWEKPGRVVCNAVLRLPSGSPALERLNAFCATQYPIPPWFPEEERERLEAARDAGAPVHVGDMTWGVPGPAAVTHFLRETGEIGNALPQAAFYPIAFKDRRDLLAPGADLSDRIGPETWGVHLWNRRLRRRLVTHHGGVPHPDSFVGRAVARHGIDCAAAPIPDVPPASVRSVPPAPPTPPARLLRDAADPAADATQATPPDALSRLALRPPVHATPRFARMSDGLEETLARTGPWLAPPRDAPGDPQVLVVTAMKNEAPFILEWIAYNRLIGVDHFLVYTNDCTDNTVALLDRLAELGLVTRRDNPYAPGGKVKPQHAALKDAVRQPVYRRADWIVTIDLDEFIAIHVGDGTLGDLFAACNQPNAISLTWRFFGNGGVIGYEDRPVVAQFTRCAPEAFPDPGLAWGFKTLFDKRSCRFRRLGRPPPRRTGGRGGGCRPLGQRIGPGDAAAPDREGLAHGPADLRLPARHAQPLRPAVGRKLPRQARPRPGEPHARGSGRLLLAAAELPDGGGHPAPSPPAPARGRDRRAEGGPGSRASPCGGGGLAPGEDRGAEGRPGLCAPVRRSGRKRPGGRHLLRPIRSGGPGGGAHSGPVAHIALGRVRQKVEDVARDGPEGDDGDPAVLDPEGRRDLAELRAADLARGEGGGRDVGRGELRQHLARGVEIPGQTEDGAGVRYLGGEVVDAGERLAQPGGDGGRLRVGHEEEEFVGRHPERAAPAREGRLAGGGNVGAGGVLHGLPHLCRAQVGAQRDHAAQPRLLHPDDSGEGRTGERASRLRHPASPPPCRRTPGRRSAP
jgi:hypothetical protein